ncbi:MAG TPA: (4Fe-4S)-binding protein [Ferruginibacter sp.]|nr:(4Fe-4S)-binding protein [Ferruginibacter sp.]
MDINNITKRYSNGDITVVWQSGKCIHSANCVKNLPQVFNTKASPWINVENAFTEEIIATVNKCPSGALSIIRNNEK